MNDEKVFQLLMETNPVPDPDGLDSPLALVQLERRSPTMATKEQISPDPSPRPVRYPHRRSRVLIGAATAVLVLIVGLGTLAVIGGDKDAAVEPEVAAVESAIDARNRGDIEEYKAGLTGAELLFEEGVHVAEALSFAARRTDLADCRLAQRVPAGASTVECEFTETDDYRDAAGIVTSGTISFLVTQDPAEDGYRIIGVDEGDDRPWAETEFGMYNVAFWSWLMDAHPAVFEDIGPDTLDKIPGLNFPANRNFGVDDLHEADEMLIALEYVDEFVAQSDVYPLNP